MKFISARRALRCVFYSNVVSIFFGTDYLLVIKFVFLGFAK